MTLQFKCPNCGSHKITEVTNACVYHYLTNPKRNRWGDIDCDYEDTIIGDEDTKCYRCEHCGGESENIKDFIMELQKLVYQCPHCGSYKLTVCELREVWYDCEPHFDLNVEHNHIAPCYALGDTTEDGWADGEHHSTLKFACAKCHTEWLTTKEMYEDEALTAVDASPYRILLAAQFEPIFNRAYAVVIKNKIYEILHEYVSDDGVSYIAFTSPVDGDTRLEYLIPQHVFDGGVKFNTKTNMYYFIKQEDTIFIPAFKLLTATAPTE